MCTFTVTEQGANAPLINHTQNATPLPLTPQLPPPTIVAQSARRTGSSTGTALTTFAKDVTAGAWDILNPIAL